MRWFPTIILALTLVAAAPATGRQDQQAEAKAWFESMTTRLSPKFLDRQFKVRYRVETLVVPDPAEIAKLRAKVKEFPEHPDGAKLKWLESLVANGPVERDVTMWFFDGKYRLNEDWPALKKAGFVDQTELGDSGWKMSREALTLLGPETKRVPGHDAVVARSGPLSEIGAFYGAGLSSFGEFDQSATFVLKSDASWKATKALTDTHGRKTGTAEVTGDWDPSAKVGRCLLATFQGENSVSNEGSWHESVTGWHTNIENGLPMVTEVRISIDGKPARKLILVELAKLDPAEFHKVSSEPRPGQTDPVRGDLGLLKVEDLRGSEPVYQLRADVAQKFTTVTYGETEAGLARRIWRYSGWLAAAAVVVIVVVLRLRKS